MTPAKDHDTMDQDPSLPAAAIHLLQALVQEQVSQITDLTRALAEAQKDASADPQLLRAGMEALERRLQDLRAIGLAREAALAEKILADGSTLQRLQAERDTIAADMDRLRQSSDRDLAEQRQRATALEAELRAARDEAAALQGELNRIHASHSWKLTEPLRAGRRLLGGE